MLKQFDVKFFEALVKNRGSLVLTREQQERVLSASKKVRSVDYIFNFDVVNGAAKQASNVTRANWLFLLTNAAVYWDSFSVSDFPKVSVKFPYYSPDSPFSTPVEDWGAVPSNLVFGREGLTGKNGHFEEYKNLYYILGQRFVIQCDVKAAAGQYGHGSVILTGLEIDLDEVQ